MAHHDPTYKIKLKYVRLPEGVLSADSDANEELKLATPKLNMKSSLRARSLNKKERVLLKNE